MMVGKLLTLYLGSEDGEDNKDIDTDVDEDIHEGTLRGVTDGDGKDFGEDDHIGLDGSEGGKKEMLIVGSDEKMEHSSDKAALKVVSFLIWSSL